jgi:outer membrane receptor protein involved in Fe transport
MSSTTRSATTRFALVSVLIASPAVAGAQQPMRDSTRRDTATSWLPAVRVIAGRMTTPEAASAVIATAAAIRSVPASNAFELVRQTAGIEVHQQGQGPGFASDAVIRGFTSDHSTDVALMIDGVPVNQPVNGHAEGYADWNEMLPEAISTIRVLKGPVSPWIGNFGMGGEVEVETVSLANGTRWALRSGSFGDARASVVTGKSASTGGFVAAADAMRDDGWRRNMGSKSGHGLLNRIWFDSLGNSVSVGATAYASDWSSPGFLTLEQYDDGDIRSAVDPTDGGRTGMGTVRASLKRDISQGTLLSLLYARGGRWHIFLNIPPEGGIGEGAPSQTEELDNRGEIGGYTHFHKAIGRNDIAVGIDYRGTRAGYERYFTTRRNRDSTETRLDADFFNVAPVAELHLNPTEQFTLGIGARFDALGYGTKAKGGDTRDSDVHFVATPKLSAIYRFTPELSTYASFNGGFRAADGVISDPNLTPSREWASEVGLRGMGKRYEASVAAYSMSVEREQTFDPVSLSTTSNGRSRRRGVEADARVGVTPIVALFAHGTFNDAKYLHLVTDKGEDLRGVPVYGVARSTLESGVDFEHRGVAGSIWAAYTGPFTPINEPDVRTSSYTLVHFRTTLPIKGQLSLGIGVQNLFDRRAIELRAAGFVSPAQPRTYLVTMRYGG